MEAERAGPALEPELQGPLPRRVRWRRARWRLWLRVVLALPVTLALPVLYAPDVGLLLLAVLGSATEVPIVAREGTLRGYSITIESPRRSWSGVDSTVREVRPLEQLAWGALARRRSLPALRLGRGALQVVRVEMDGRPVDALGLAFALAFWALPVSAGLALVLWGPLARDFWLVRWGRAVPGRVRDGSSRPFWHLFRLVYEYRERPHLPTATLRGRAAVSRAQFEACGRGHPLSVLHALWNPRWSVAYPFARFAAVPDDRRREARDEISES